MDLTEKEIIYSTDERFGLIKELCHLSKNLYNASLYDVRQYYFETKSYRPWQSQRPIFTKNHNPDYYALQSHLAGEVLIQVGKQFIGFFNNKSDKKKRIPKYKDKIKMVIMLSRFLRLLFLKELNLIKINNFILTLCAKEVIT